MIMWLKILCVMYKEQIILILCKVYIYIFQVKNALTCLKVVQDGTRYWGGLIYNTGAYCNIHFLGISKGF